MRLRQLERRHAHLALQRAAQMALAHPQLRGKLSYAATVQRARRDPLRRRLRQPRHRVELRRRSTRGQLGTAPQTRPESRALGGGGRVEKAPVTIVREA